VSGRVHVGLESVVKEYGPRRSRRTAVQEVTVAFDERSRVGIVGGSGSGKSTLARLLVGLEQPTAGTVRFDGEPVERILRSRADRIRFRRAVQFVGQNTTSSFDPRRRLIDSLTDPLRWLGGAGPAEALGQAHATLAALRLDPELAERYPDQVSGGQRQRFAIARSLTVRPRLLICDEVVSALDVSVQGAILNLIKDYCRDNQAGLVFVSHGLPATGFVADELLVMHQGRIVERGPTAARPPPVVATVRRPQAVPTPWSRRWPRSPVGSPSTPNRVATRPSSTPC